MGPPQSARGPLTTAHVDRGLIFSAVCKTRQVYAGLALNIGGPAQSACGPLTTAHADRGLIFNAVCKTRQVYAGLALNIGGPARTRTWDQGIMSPLL